MFFVDLLSFATVLKWPESTRDCPTNAPGRKHEYYRVLLTQVVFVASVGSLMPLETYHITLE